MNKKIQRVLVELEGEKPFVGYVVLQECSTVSELMAEPERMIEIYTLDCRCCCRSSLTTLDEIHYYTRIYKKSKINSIKEYSEVEIKDT